MGCNIHFPLAWGSLFLLHCRRGGPPRCWRLMRVLQTNGARKQVHEGNYDESRQALDVVLFEPLEGGR